MDQVSPSQHLSDVIHDPNSRYFNPVKSSEKHLQLTAQQLCQQQPALYTWGKVTVEATMSDQGKKTLMEKEAASRIQSSYAKEHGGEVHKGTWPAKAQSIADKREHEATHGPRATGGGKWDCFEPQSLELVAEET